MKLLETDQAAQTWVSCEDKGPTLLFVSLFSSPSSSFLSSWISSCDSVVPVDNKQASTYFCCNFKCCSQSVLSAPHQELLGTIKKPGFNSSQTTEVKAITQCFQTDTASKEPFIYHKLFPFPAVFPKFDVVLLKYWNISQAYLPSFIRSAHMEYKEFFWTSFSFFLCWIDSWINKYCLKDFVVTGCRSSAELAITYAITGICLVLVTGKLSFSANLFFYILFEKSSAI